MSKKYLAMMTYTVPTVDINGLGDWPVRLPEGCLGLMYVFRTKKAAREWCGKSIRLLELSKE